MDLYKGLFVVVSEGKLQRVMPAERIPKKDGIKYFKAISRGNCAASLKNNLQYLLILWNKGDSEKKILSYFVI